MIKCRCSYKHRNSTDRILWYQIEMLDGTHYNVSPEELKEKIRNKEIEVVNLTLTSDNRLVNSTDNMTYGKFIKERERLIKENQLQMNVPIEQQAFSGNQFDDDSEYIEAVPFFRVARIHILKGMWKIHFDRYSKGSIVDTGYTIFDTNIDTFVNSLTKEWAKAKSRLTESQGRGFEYEVEPKFIIRTDGDRHDRVVLWLRGSEVFIRNDSDIQELIRVIEYCKKRKDFLIKGLGFEQYFRQAQAKQEQKKRKDWFSGFMNKLGK